MEYSPSGHFAIKNDLVNSSVLQRAGVVFDSRRSLKISGTIPLREQELAAGFTQELLERQEIPITWVVAADTQNPFLQVPGRATIKIGYIRDDTGQLKRQLTFGIVPIRGQSRFTAQRVIFAEGNPETIREGLDETVSDEVFIKAITDLIDQTDFSDQSTTLVNVYSVDH